MREVKLLDGQPIEEAIKKDVEEIFNSKKILCKPLSINLSHEIRQDLDYLSYLANLNAGKAPVISHRPVFGKLITYVKKFIAKATFWIYQPLFEQISNFNYTVINILNKLTAYLDMNDKDQLHAGHIFEEKSEVVNDKSVDNFERASIGWFYHAFEQKFRGSEELIKNRQSIYIDYIRKAFKFTGGKVLDIGSGRGEFLELLRDEGIPAIGVDLNEVMVRQCRDKGLIVEQRDAYDSIAAQDDQSLAAVTAFQVIEHLNPGEMWKIISTALVKLRPGGLIILETVNPECLFALSNFYLDLTHRKPIPPSTLKFLLEFVGFKNVEVRFSSLLPEKYRLKGNDSNIKKLNEILFGWRDYAVLGWRR